MRLTLCAATAAVGLALAVSSGAEAATLTLLGTPTVHNQPFAEKVDYRDRCDYVRRECREAFVPGSWRFRRCVRIRHC